MISEENTKWEIKEIDSKLKQLRIRKSELLKELAGKF
jgi:hypothetical protein|tara:strand:+ start:465 stop:575 length:111 start_codon:yes stop_codon:yes gene_type:complete